MSVLKTKVSLLKYQQSIYLLIHTSQAMFLKTENCKKLLDNKKIVETVLIDL